MATVTPDLIINSSASFNINSGGICRRVFRVDGLVSGPNIAFDAISAVQGSGAPLYAQHPTAVNYFVQGYDTAPCGDQRSPGGTSIWVTVIYGTATSTPNFVLIEMSGSNSQEILNRWPDGDQQGQPIFVGYTVDVGGETTNFPDQILADNTSDDVAGPGVYYDTVAIPIESHNQIIRFTRMEAVSPLGAIQQFRQKVNSSPMWGYPAGAILCRNITAANIISGSIIAPGMYNVVYEFEASVYPWGFKRVEFFRDIQTGKPVATDLSGKRGRNNGYTIINPYGNGVDFSALKLPDPRKGSTGQSQ